MIYLFALTLVNTGESQQMGNIWQFALTEVKSDVLEVGSAICVSMEMVLNELSDIGQSPSFISEGTGNSFIL